jgi:replication factor C subunit 1
MEGIQPAVKAALTKAYKQGSASRVVRSADLITLPGVKKAPKKRIAAILEPPVETETSEENGTAPAEGEEEENPSDAENDGISFLWIFFNLITFYNLQLVSLNRFSFLLLITY